MGKPGMGNILGVRRWLLGLRPLVVGLLALALVALAPLGGGAATMPAERDFASAADAVAALVAAVQSGDTGALQAVLGPGSEKLVASGDPVADANARAKFLENYAASHLLTPVGDTRMVLTVGPNAWPLPIPLVKSDAGWHFDAASAAQEIVDRRIGRNELRTIRTLLALVAAQQDYFERVKAGTGAGAYAQHIVSAPGKQDGLYWETAGDEAASPLEPLVAEAREEGYPGATARGSAQMPYNGYLFRLLTAQGPSAPGGAKSYVQNGRMTEGFAFLAWPADHANSGVVSLLVDQDGVVFQKDLGPDTAKVAGQMRRFDPDVTWARVDIVD
jgi:Protein of unknown function (DUF2950)